MSGLARTLELKRWRTKLAMQSFHERNSPSPPAGGFGERSRDDWIRTSDPFVPNEVRYRTALHPEYQK